MPEGQKLQLRKKILMFSVFLLISVFIWLLNAMSKNYTTVIEYPLIYTDFPAGRVFVGDMPDHLELRINAHGYAILRYKTLGKTDPIRFEVSAFNLSRPDNDSSRAYILTRYLRDQVSRQLPAEIQLLEIRPDTLHFRFAKKISRKMRIRPDFKFKVDKQFTVKDGIRLEPDSVEVTGPDMILDTMRCVYTVRSDIGQLSKDYSDKVKLRKVGDLEYEFSKVHCSIELERYTEVQLSIPVEVLNLPDTISLQTFPSRIQFSCKVGLSKYDRIQASPVRAVVDYSKISEKTNVLDVQLQNIPVYLISYEYYPKTVEFLKTRR
jgi:hypothetical protein